MTSSSYNAPNNKRADNDGGISETQPLLATAIRTPSETTSNAKINEDILEEALKLRLPSNIQSGTTTYSHPKRTPTMPTNGRGHNRGVSLSSLFHSSQTTSDIRDFARDVVTTTATDLKDTFQKDMHVSRSGQRFFMDMTMTRSLSVVPEQLSDLFDEAIEDFRLSSRISVEYHPLRSPIQEEAVETSFLRSDEHDNKYNRLETAETVSTLATSQDATISEQAGTTGVPAEDAKEYSKGRIVSAYIGLFVAVLAVSSNGTALSLLHGVEPCLKLYWRMTATAFNYWQSIYRSKSIVHRSYWCSCCFFRSNIVQC